MSKLTKINHKTFKELNQYLDQIRNLKPPKLQVMIGEIINAVMTDFQENSNDEFNVNIEMPRVHTFKDEFSAVQISVTIKFDGKFLEFLEVIPYSKLIEKSDEPSLRADIKISKEPLVPVNEETDTTRTVRMAVKPFKSFEEPSENSEITPQRSSIRI